MTVTVQAVGTFSAAATPHTPTMPTHQADDILFVPAVCNDTLSTATSGWTEFITASVSGTEFSWFWKRATGAGTAGPTITGNRGTNLQACGIVIRGCIASGTPFEDATISSSTSDATPDTALVTSTGTARLALCSYIQRGTNAFSSGLPPSGWATEQNTTDNLSHRHTVISKTHSSIGDLASVVIGTTTASGFAAVTLLFIPAAIDATVTAVRAVALGDSPVPTPRLSVSPAAGIARKGTVTHALSMNVTMVAARAAGDVTPPVVTQPAQAPPYANVAIGSA